MPDSDCSDGSSIIDIDDVPSSVPPPKYQRKRLKPPSTSAILEQGDRDFRKPPAPAVKCHILGVAVLHDLLKVKVSRTHDLFSCNSVTLEHLSFLELQHFERRQGQPLAQESRRHVERMFNSAANFVLSMFLFLLSL